MNADARIRLSREIAAARRIARHATSTDAEQHIRTLAKLADTTGALAARDWLLNLAALGDLHHETRAGRDQHTDTRCPACDGLNGAHGHVHTRHPQGGGGANTPCPNTPTSEGTNDA